MYDEKPVKSSSFSRREGSHRHSKESRKSSKHESSEKQGSMVVEHSRFHSSSSQDWFDSHGKERVRSNGHMRHEKKEEDPWDVALRKYEHGAHRFPFADPPPVVRVDEAFDSLASQSFNLTLEEQKVRAWDDRGAFRNLMVAFALTSRSKGAEEMEGCGAVDAFGGPNLHSPEVFWPTLQDGGPTRGAEVVAASSDELHVAKLAKPRTMRKKKREANPTGASALQSCGSGVKLFPSAYTFGCDPNRPLLPSPAHTPLVLSAHRLGSANGGPSSKLPEASRKPSAGAGTEETTTGCTEQSNNKGGRSKPPPQMHRRGHSGGRGGGLTGSGPLLGDTVGVASAFSACFEANGCGKGHSRTAHGMGNGIHRRTSSKESGKGLLGLTC